MILKEKLERMIPRNINVKIGSGTQFIYCGKCDENILETIARISQDYYFKLTDKIQELESYLANFDDYWEERMERSIRQWINSKEKRPTDRMLEKYKEKLLIKKEEDMKFNLDLLKKKQDEEKNFTSFLMRKVIKSYPSIDSDEIAIYGDIKIIIIEGKERGKYWTIEEFREKKGEEDDL